MTEMPKVRKLTRWIKEDKFSKVFIIRDEDRLAQLRFIRDRKEPYLDLIQELRVNIQKGMTDKKIDDILCDIRFKIFLDIDEINKELKNG